MEEDYFLRLKRYQTPENYFREALEMQDGIPFAIQPYEEMKKRFYAIRDYLKKQPEKANGAFFRMFHRKDGFFCLIRKGLERMHDVGAVPLDETEEHLERLYKHVPEALRDNVYFTVNSYCRSLGSPRKSTYLARSARKEFNLRWLNACYVDIDVGRFGCEDEYLLGSKCPELLPDEILTSKPASKSLSWEQALLQAMILEERGIIPPVSIYARSGRGIYLFWLLEPVFYHFENEWILHDFKNCNKALLNTVRGDLEEPVLPGDPAATDGARILRIHGSRHTSTGTRVCYCPSTLDEVEKIYTLQEIMDFFGIASSKPDASRPERIIFKSAKQPFFTPKRKAGHIARMKYLIADTEKLFNACLIKKGKRYFSLRYLATFKRYAGVPEAETITSLEQLATLCQPPYPTAREINDIPVRKIVEALYQEKGAPQLFSNAVLVEFWKIDKETAERLELQKLRPLEAGKILTVSDKQKAIIARREALLRLEPEKFSYPELLSMMKDKGYQMSETTLRSDLAYLQHNGVIKRQNQKGGRPKKKQE